MAKVKRNKLNGSGGGAGQSGGIRRNKNTGSCSTGGPGGGKGGGRGKGTGRKKIVAGL